MKPLQGTQSVDLATKAIQFKGLKKTSLFFLHKIKKMHKNLARNKFYYWIIANKMVYLSILV
ncbi:MAG: hypothetical protein ATN34_03130 [Epulopiscium sp. Nele67-Bin002]|nr:MAG: hypothetical protein ATN34_03130 [Epulopiscium sp. Nele67-Bin002]OON93371.1 MAG: hypothetical protein ATN33_05895 [Epulopiscium sp. Nele67-Bin001]